MFLSLELCLGALCRVKEEQLGMGRRIKKTVKLADDDDDDDIPQRVTKRRKHVDGHRHAPNSADKRNIKAQKQNMPVSLKPC